MRAKCGLLSANVKTKRPLLFDRIAADNPHMENEVLDTIKQVIDELGITPEEAAKRSGLERSYFRKLFERGTTPKLDTMRKISLGLDVPLDRLSGGARSSDKNENGYKTLRIPDRHEMPNDVPVLGTAAGSHLRGAFQLTTDPVDFVRRPPALMGARDIYSLYVEGESMVPQFWPADLLFISPHKPVKVGDPVVIQSQLTGNGAIEATIGIFLRRSTDWIVIQKHNPRAEIEISRATLISMHKVLTMNELFGV